MKRLYDALFPFIFILGLMIIVKVISFVGNYNLDKI